MNPYLKLSNFSNYVLEYNIDSPFLDFRKNAIPLTHSLKSQHVAQMDSTDLKLSDYLCVSEECADNLLKEYEYKTLYSEFFVYKTPWGVVPIVHMYKTDLKRFIDNIENDVNDTFYFISNPISNGYDHSKYCSAWLYENKKFYFVDYEDGNSAFCCYFTLINVNIINNLKNIYNKIPNDIDDVL